MSTRGMIKGIAAKNKELQRLKRLRRENRAAVVANEALIKKLRKLIKEGGEGK